MLIAINEELPWQFILAFCTSVCLAFILSGILPGIAAATGLKYYFARITCGVMMFIAGMLSWGAFFTIVEMLHKVATKHLPDFINRIIHSYRNEEFKVKKQVLDEVIEKEILK